MKKLILLLLTAILIFPQFVAAAVTFDINNLRAVIDSDDIVEAGKNIIFDGSNSFLPDEDAETTYEWDFGDGTKVSGMEVVHSYTTANEYLVTLTVTQNEESSSIARDVFAYDKLAILLTDISEQKASIENLTKKAHDSGTFINVIESYDSETAFVL